MMAPRGFLPTLNAWLAFEAVARLGSATRAALGLSLTQSAISRHLKTLEEQLGVGLMDRQVRQLVLTEAGKSLWNQPVADQNREK